MGSGPLQNLPPILASGQGPTQSRTQGPRDRPRAGTQDPETAGTCGQESHTGVRGPQALGYE